MGELISQDALAPEISGDIQGQEIGGRYDLRDFARSLEDISRFEVLREPDSILQVRVTYPVTRDDLPELIRLLQVR